MLKSFKKWLDRHQPKQAPKTPLGRAIRYTLKQWKALGRFLEDVRVPLDNNASEAALRRVALGRKNFLFVGNDESGEHLATLHTLVATCEANGINPVEYLTDVLARVNDHPVIDVNYFYRSSRRASLLRPRAARPSSGDGPRTSASSTGVATRSERNWRERVRVWVCWCQPELSSASPEALSVSFFLRELVYALMRQPQ